MNKLTTAKRTAVVAALVEGVSIRAISRMTGVSKTTVLKLLADLGEACAAYLDTTLRNLPTKRVECDEIWSFCYAKERSIRIDPSIKDRNANAGDVWTWTAIDADSKLCVSYLVADRTLPSAKAFMQDVASRLANRVQLTTDAYRMYLTAVEDAFGIDVDYAQLHKIYTSDASGRYSPPVCIGCKKIDVSGAPEPTRVSTAYVERQNLTMRMHMRRFTRLTNGHSKTIEMHAAAVALHFMHYNFAKIHETLRVTPAMAAGLSSSAWEIADIIALLDA